MKIGINQVAANIENIKWTAENPDNVYALFWKSSVKQTFEALDKVMTQRQTHIHLNQSMFRQLIVELFIKNIDQMLAQTKARVIFFTRKNLLREKQNLAKS